MISRRAFGGIAMAATLAACGGNKSHLIDGKPVTQVIVRKSARKVFLMYDREVLRSYNMNLGFAPVGHKQFEGDGKTPEGVYYIDRHNPQSRYHLSIGISYPNPRDRAFAASNGRRPGGDIFIHGTPRDERGKRDWTAGCVAVSNRDMDTIFYAVRDGTPVIILP